MILDTTVLNVNRSINQSKLFFDAKIDAERGEEYSNAN